MQSDREELRKRRTEDAARLRERNEDFLRKIAADSHRRPTDWDSWADCVGRTLTARAESAISDACDEVRNVLDKVYAAAPNYEADQRELAILMEELKR